MKKKTSDDNHGCMVTKMISIEIKQPDEQFGLREKKRFAQKVYSCAKFGAQPKPCELFDLFTVLPMFCIFCFSITCATDNNL